MAQTQAAPNMPPTPDGNPNRNFHEFSPESVGGVTVLNKRTNFKALSSAHKKSFVGVREAQGSAYIDLVPETGHLPKPDDLSFTARQREQLINDGTIPEVMPFMIGARIALAERRAKRQHRKARRIARRLHVASRVAESIVTGTSHSNTEDEFRPRTLKEKAMARRMGHLITRANNRNSIGNLHEEMFTYKDTVTTPSGPQVVKRVDFRRDMNNLSIFEKGQRRSAEKRHRKQGRHSDKLIHGYRIRGTDIRPGLFSFESLANGGPGNSMQRANKALEKRDQAILRAEALRQERVAVKHARSALITAFKGDLQSSWRNTKKAGVATAKFGLASALVTKNVIKYGAIVSAENIKQFALERIYRTKGFATALKSDEIPEAKRNILGADIDYEARPEHNKGFKKRTAHEAKMYGKNFHEGGKAVKRAWRKRK